MVTTVSLILIAVVISGIFRFRIDLTSPQNIFLMGWLAVLIIYELDIFPNYGKITLITTAFLIALVGVIILSFQFGRRITLVSTPVNYHYRRLLVSEYVLTLIVMVAFAVTWIKLGPPPTLGNSIARSDYYLSGVETFYLQIYLAFFLDLYIVKRFKRLVPILPSVMALSTMLILKGNKTSVIIVLLMMLFFFGSKIGVGKLFLIGLSVFVVFYLASFIYLNAISDADALKAAKVGMTGFSLPGSLYLLYDPLIYIVSNVYNLNSLVSAHVGGISLGSMSFSGFVIFLGKILPNLGQIRISALGTMLSTLRFPGFNTFTGFGSLYTDFDFIGTGIVTFLISFMAGICYKHRNFRSNSIVSLFLDFSLYETLALMFFSFYLGNIEVITNLMVACVIHFIGRNKAVE